MSSFRTREKRLELGMQVVVGSEPVGGLRPGGGWRLRDERPGTPIREFHPSDDLVLGLNMVPGLGVPIPDRDWRFEFGDKEYAPLPVATIRVTMDGSTLLTMDGRTRTVVD